MEYNRFICFLFFLTINIISIKTLNNGLAKTPPMGWLAWERFRCNIDCEKDPDNCISERLFKQMADVVATDGYKDAGYQYINIDDCWLANERDSNGRLQPDSKRFPSGIKALSDYIHSKGLKFGIYEDFGIKTCAGFPGSEYFLQKDAETFASWGVDMLKFDGCNSLPEQMDDAYPAMSYWLNKTGRPMLFSCSWPAYQMSIIPNYQKIAKYCNIWRNFDDIQDSWQSVLSVINYYGTDKGNFSMYAKSGSFNDPDMLILGNFGLSYEQERVQMAMWAMLAAPLFISADLRKMRQSSKELLLNKNLINLNQDSLGNQAVLIRKVNDIQVWTKKLSNKKSFAFAYLKTGDDGMPSYFSFPLDMMGGFSNVRYKVYELFGNTMVTTLLGKEMFGTYVNPSGIFLGKAIEVA